jgi:recombination protein RecA
MIEKQFGKGSIMKLGDKDGWMQVETSSSGSLSLDMALGWWYAKWRIIEIYWPESSGKTTLTLHAIAEVQKSGWTAAFIDAEHALDPSYAKKIWVDVDNLIISQPDYGEQALEIVDALVRSWAVDLIVVDSVAALTPKAEIEWDMWDSHMGLQARLMSQALRKITWAISRSWTTVIFINQIRMKIWVMFGSPETTTWGNALKFYASQRIDVRRKAKIEAWTGLEKEATWNLTKVKVIKNKIAPPFKEAEFDIMYNEWISKVWEILDIWAQTWVIKKSWAFYSYWETRLGQGREKAKAFLKENPEIASEIEEVIKNSLED